MSFRRRALSVFALSLTTGLTTWGPTASDFTASVLKVSVLCVSAMGALLVVEQAGGRSTYFGVSVCGAGAAVGAGADPDCVVRSACVTVVVWGAVTVFVWSAD